MKTRTQTLAILILIAVLGFSAIGTAQVGTWTQKSDMPTVRGGLSTSVVNGKIYAIGGFAGTNASDILATVEVYDPVTDTWIHKSDMLTPRFGLSCSAVNEKIYAIGGWTPMPGASGVRSVDTIEATAAVEEYDPITDTWTKKSELSMPRAYASISVLDGKIYVIGGFRWGPDGETILIKSVEIYDPAIDSWTKKSDMPIARNIGSASVVSAKIYAIGGFLIGPGLSRSDVEEYDSVTDTWLPKARMSTARCCFSTSVVDGRIYAIGGNPTSGSYTPTVEVYNPATDAWIIAADMPEPRSDHSTSVVNGLIYAIGGNVLVKGAVMLSPTVFAYDTGVGIRVTAISLQEGLVTGGGPIAIFGAGFPVDAVVTIGGTPLIDLAVSNIAISGVIPPGIAGEHIISITAPSIDFDVFAGKFFYREPSAVVLSGMTPTNGAQAGGESGSITGGGFQPGATVRIGSGAATDVTVTPTLLTFTIPAGTEGAVDVVVTNPDEQGGILRGAYSYNPFPVLDESFPIKPDEGPLSGGTSITITGQHFIDGAAVEIGGTRVGRLDFLSADELRLQTPAGTAGPQAVTVINPDGQSVTVAEAFTYNPAPTITRILPNAGTLEGGTQIVIRGTGFLLTLQVDVIIGGVQAEIENVLLNGDIVARTPPSQTPGPRDVRVVNRDGRPVGHSPRRLHLQLRASHQNHHPQQRQSERRHQDCDSGQRLPP